MKTKKQPEEQFVCTRGHGAFTAPVWSERLKAPHCPKCEEEVSRRDDFLGATDRALKRSAHLQKSLADERERFEAEETAKILRELAKLRRGYLAISSYDSSYVEGLRLQDLLRDIGRDVVETGGLGERAENVLKERK